MKTLREKRINALYEAVNYANGNQKKDMLSFLTAIINHKQIKEFCDEFDLKIK